MSTITDSINVTKLLSQGDWNGNAVMVQADPLTPLCPPGEHDLRQVHHYGPDGHDYGPTGFLMCVHCLGWTDEPGSGT